MNSLDSDVSKTFGLEEEVITKNDEVFNLRMLVTLPNNMESFADLNSEKCKSCIGDYALSFFERYNVKPSVLKIDLKEDTFVVKCGYLAPKDPSKMVFRAEKSPSNYEFASNY